MRRHNPTEPHSSEHLIPRNVTLLLWPLQSTAEPSSGAIFVLLVASTALFVGLGYGHRNDRLTVGRRPAGLVVLACCGIGLVLVGADSVSGDLEYTADLEDEVVIDASETDPETDRLSSEHRLGTLTLTNPTPFARSVDPPPVEGCLVDSAGEMVDYDLRVGYDRSSFALPNQLGRSDELTLEIEATLVSSAAEFEEGESVPVERGASCEVTRSEPTMIVGFDERDHSDPTQPV